MVINHYYFKYSSLLKIPQLQAYENNYNFFFNKISKNDLGTMSK